MEFIVDTATHRRAFGEHRLLFSWGSFYAGVGLALAMMLISYNVGRSNVVAVAAPSVVEQPVVTAQVPSLNASTVTAAEVVAAIEHASFGASGQESAAVAYLRTRGSTLVNAIDRDYAVLAVVELSGKPRAEAERMVDAWLQMGKFLAR